ncbi:MAG: TIGR02281 family clan AA aspartic protease [Novosphingobium sp.]
MQPLIKQVLVWVAVMFVAAQIATGAMSGAGGSSAAAGARGAGVHAPKPESARFGMDQMVLQRGSGGQFHLTANVNGMDASFLVDTGADVVALTEQEADRLGVYYDPNAFRPIMRTAAGVGNGQVVTIDLLEFGGREYRHVEAVVLQGLHVNLLGQNVLSRFGKIEMRGDEMVITQ